MTTYPPDVAAVLDEARDMDLAKLVALKEELDPDLAAYVRPTKTLGAFIQHPLLYQPMAMPAMNAVYNRQYRAKKALVEYQIRQGDWLAVLALFEKPVRLSVVKQYGFKMTAQQYWHAVRLAWSQSENLWQFEPALKRGLWLGLYGPGECLNPDSHKLCMEPEELPEFLKLEEQAKAGGVTLYRGCRGKYWGGMSWTTNRDKAIWFATRFGTQNGQSPRLLTARVDHPLVMRAYLDTRGECEVVCDLVKRGKTTKRGLHVVTDEAL